MAVNYFFKHNVINDDYPYILLTIHLLCNPCWLALQVPMLDWIQLRWPESDARSIPTCPSCLVSFLSFRGWIHEIKVVSWWLFSLLATRCLLCLTWKLCLTTLPLLAKTPWLKSKYKYTPSRLRNSWLGISWLELHANKHAISERHLSLILRWFERIIVAAITDKFLNANSKIQWFCFAACFNRFFTWTLNFSHNFINSKSDFCLSLSDTLLDVAAVLLRSRKSITNFTHTMLLSNEDGWIVSSLVSVIKWTQ